MHSYTVGASNISNIRQHDVGSQLGTYSNRSVFMVAEATASP